MPWRRSTGLLAQADAKVEEHDVSADEQHTARLVQTFRNRVAAAKNHESLTAALAHGRAGRWASVDDGELTVQFELAAPPDEGAKYPYRHAEPVAFEPRLRVTFPVVNRATHLARLAPTAAVR